MASGKDSDDLSTVTLGVLGAMTSELERTRNLLSGVMPGIHTELRGHEPWVPYAHQLSGYRTSSVSTSMGVIDAVLSASIQRLTSDAASLGTKVDSIRDAMRATSHSVFEGLQIAPDAIRALNDFQSAKLGKLPEPFTVDALDFSRVQGSVAAMLASNIDRPARALLEQIAAVSPLDEIDASLVSESERVSSAVAAVAGIGRRSIQNDAHAVASSNSPIAMVVWLRQYDFLASWLSLVVALLSVLHVSDASATDRLEDTLSELVLEVARIERQLADQSRPRHLLKPAPLRSAPTSESSLVCRVLPAHAVTAIFSEGRWMFVTVEDETGTRTNGWLFERHLR